MDENDTKLTNFETPETENDKNNSNVILFSDYTPSDILGIVRVPLLSIGYRAFQNLIVRER